MQKTRGVRKIIFLAKIENKSRKNFRNPESENLKAKKNAKN